MHLNYFTRYGRRTFAVLLSFLFLFSLEVHAQQIIKLRYQAVPLKTVLRELTRQTGYSVAYSDALQQMNVLITCDINSSEPLGKVLTLLLDGKGVAHTITGKQIILVPVEMAVKEGQKAEQPRRIKVSGKVTDEAGEPLPGVTVLNKTTNQVQASDLDGHYAIEAKEGDLLAFASIGMMDYNAVLGKGAVLNVAMKPDVIALEDVVVTGYQTLSKERSAGSYKIVKGDEIKDRASTRGSIIESLEGMSTGLSMNYGDGEQKVLIRGTNSINSNQSVLYVVDGVAMSGENIETMINNNDIASVTVLKDATAASIWGARAANGVIVVTTKTGNRNKKVEVQYDGSFTYSGLPDYDYLGYMSSEMFMKNARELFNPDYFTWNAITTTTLGMGTSGKPVVFPHEQPMYDHYNGKISQQEMEARLGEMASANNRRQVEEFLMSKKLRTNHSLSVSGGGEKYSYYGSFLYEYDQNTNRTQNNKYAINLKQDFNLAKWLKLDAVLNVSMTDRENGMTPSVTNPNTLFPYAMLQDANGNNLSHSRFLIYEPLQATMEQQSGVSLNYTPLDELGYSYNTSSGMSMRVNLGANVKLYKGLTFDSRYQYAKGTTQTDLFYGEESYDVRLERVQFTEVPKAGQTVGTAHLPSTGGKYTNTHTSNSEWTLRNQFAYDGTVAKRHQVSAIAGMEIRNNKFNSASSLVRGYDPQTMIYVPVDEKTLKNPGIKNPVYPSGGSIPTQILRGGPSYNETEMRFVSFYANLAYTYDNRYTFNGSIRVDQSNLFGSDPSVQFKPLWALGGAWNLKNEPFLSGIKKISRLVFRASYGLGGNSPDPGMGGPYDIIKGSNSSLFPSPGYNIITPANNKLIWEKTATINVGVDFGFFNNRLGGSVDFYDRNTTDLLNKAPVNPSTGWEATLSNVGSLYNRGVEIALNSVNIESRGFTWRTNFTFTYNKNKVTELYDEDGLTATNMPYKKFVAGYPAYSMFAFQWAGLDNMGNPQVYDNGQKVKLYKDLTDLESVSYLGSTQPLYFGALTNSFSFRGFDFSFMFVYNLGHKMRRMEINPFSSGRMSGNILEEFDNRWRVPGDENTTAVPAYVANTGEEGKSRYYRFYTQADINVLSASYIKLRDVTLSYSLPSRICKKIFAQNIRFKFQVGDLFLIAKNKEGIDPEYHSLRFGNRILKNGPTYSFGLNVKF